MVFVYCVQCESVLFECPRRDSELRELGNVAGKGVWMVVIAGVRGDGFAEYLGQGRGEVGGRWQWQSQHVVAACHGEASEEEIGQRMNLVRAKCCRLNDSAKEKNVMLFSVCDLSGNSRWVRPKRATTSTVNFQSEPGANSQVPSSEQLTSEYLSISMNIQLIDRLG